MFKRVLISNRGEIAIRIARAASALGVESVGLFAPADAQALHTRITTEAREIPSREAGAGEVLITSSQRWVLMHELRGEAEPSLTAQLQRLSPCDLVLVEGYKHESIAKIEVHRVGARQPLLQPADAHIVAVASDGAPVCAVPVLDLNRPDDIARFICEFLESHHDFTPAIP